ncbi:MAG TPA: HAD-IB family hydrolase [Solirubrobacteraceae bacterium]|nr:HAD-IB family hydrolase [Solirubrobacteraceae bacterium]
MSDVRELIEEIESGPEGPEVGAFFDLDGTLIAGYSANVFYQEFIRRRQMSPGAIARSVAAGIDMGVRGADVSRLVEIVAGSFRGHPEDELVQLGERLFVQRIAGMVYPDARQIVRAHQRKGHTIALASSATRYQVAPLAADLDIDHVLTTALEVVDGVFTGALGGKVLWGPEKARAVRDFARTRRVDLRRSYGYGNGDEDMYFLDAVGAPRALNPQAGLAGVAADRGWPAYRLAGRGRPGLEEVVRTGAAIAGLGTAAALGVMIGVVNRSRRDGANFATSVGADAALALAGVRLRIIGEEHLWSQRPAVFIFNHQSSIDMPIVGSLVRRDLTGVAKKEAARDPRFAPIGFLVDVAYVDRGNTNQARAALAPVVEKLHQGVSIGIAPEGTRSATPRLGRFKKGAFHIAMQAGVPIVPIVIHNAGDVMWKGSPLIRKGTVDVSVLEPITTKGWKAGELDERVTEVRQLYLETLEQWPRLDG